jgi:hypothetical protein
MVYKCYEHVLIMNDPYLERNKCIFIQVSLHILKGPLYPVPWGKVVKV